ncbi:MAG: hypothetical protein AMJ90_07855 [candidate division Zixibacteria bacterium SM23_73_2]|nr:MAG: hypothetical protein AMJ90_07855 [candidate division Zixibacteria bacterium SM23_73_2]
MVDFLLNLDIGLFYFINLKIQNPVFDFIMVWITTRDFWLVPMWLTWLLLVIFGGRRGRIFGVLIIILIAITDQTSSHLLKPLIGRVRPCNILPDVRLLIGCSKAGSFPSSHATNLFAAATLISYFYHKVRAYFFVIAFLVAFSRIYVGVHYPSDMLGGALLGFLCAGMIILLFKFIDSKTHWLGIGRSVKGE